MRSLLFKLALLITCFCFISFNVNAQWDKMSVGTKLTYGYTYRFVKVDDSTSDFDTIQKGQKIVTIRIDTIVQFSENKKIVLFSEIFDPYGNGLLNMQDEFYNEVIPYGLPNKNKCSLFYFLGDAVYGIAVDKAFLIYCDLALLANLPL